MTKNNREERSREARVRRLVTKSGFVLSKSRSRDQRSPDFGRYAIIDPDTNGTINPQIAQRWICSWTLDDVEAWLNE